MELISDEGSESPLPGNTNRTCNLDTWRIFLRMFPLTPCFIDSIQFKRNQHLDELRRACIQALHTLTVKVNDESAQLALFTTVELLKESILRNKPLHTVNAMTILKVLYTAFESVSVTVCKGAVSFLEPNCGGPLNVATTIRKGDELDLPSALSCIYYLFITRTVLERSTDSPESDVTSTDSYEHGQQEIEKGFLHISPGAWAMSEIADKHLESDLFAVLDMVARSQIESNNITQLVTLIHWGVLGNILTRYQSRRLECRVNTRIDYDCDDKDRVTHHSDDRKDWFGILDKALRIMDVITQDNRCCRSLCGWSVTQESWKPDFSFEQVKALAGLLEIQPAQFKHVTVG
jgi:hypothetical protein